MKKILIIAFMITALVGSSKAQDYNNGLGIRFGGYSGTGLTFKHFTNSNTAIEVLLTSYYYRGFTVTGLYEKHQTAFQTSGLKFFYGIGGHIGAYRSGRYRYYYYNDRYYNDGFAVAGVDAILGLEYKIPSAPFTIGADIHPIIELINYPGLVGLDGALTIRYTF